jgi:predicted nucleic acid-binding protein
LGRLVVDTSVWSMALRRLDPLRLNDKESRAREELEEHLRTGEGALIGAVRQEILGGIRPQGRFDDLRIRLMAVPHLPTVVDDYERAAAMANTCRAAGVQGSPTDFLICAVSERAGIPIFTLDRDFEGFARHLPIQLHQY